MTTTCVVCNERTAEWYFQTLGVCIPCRQLGPEPGPSWDEEMYVWLMSRVVAREPATQGALL